MITMTAQHEQRQVVWEHKGVRCVRRLGDWGIWCGYVELPSHHRWRLLPQLLESVRVHGGVTFADEMPPFGFMVGFDCAHGGLDAVPAFPQSARAGVFRDENYVTAETERLAELALEAAQ